jgi:imidazolonepropionase
VGAVAATSLLVTGIGELVTNDPHLGTGILGLLHDAAVIAEGDRIAWVGPARESPAADERLDAGGRAVLPGFVDSHTHLIFAGDRAAEFAARMAGQPYSAGGIRTTVTATRAASDRDLTANARRLLGEMLRQGTTTAEIKSGYGLTVHDERRSLEIAAGLTTETTFLGAHVVPAEYADDPAGYVSLVTGPMLGAAAPHARWIDVFVELSSAAFGEDSARAVLAAGSAAGLGVRVHAAQLQPGPGPRLAAEFGAASADHCTHLTDVDVIALRDAGVVATLLPAAEFSTRSPYPDARRLLDAGVRVALATDCNPGTSYTTSMPFVVALAVRELRMTPAEAVHAATAGGAAALRRDDIGSVTPGTHADLVLLDAPSHVHLAYRPGVPIVRSVVRGGQVERWSVLGSSPVERM